MNRTVRIAAALALAAAAGIFLWNTMCAGAAQNVRIIKHDEQKAAPVSPDNFTGAAASRGFFPAKEIGVSTGEVTFPAGARTAWHTHPRGQMLIITSGRGLVRQWGEAPVEMNEGDAVWIPANVKHWHGAAPDSSMSHIAMAPLDEEGRSSTWMEKTSGADYPGK
ncbi:cupin domain-containing protein [Cloacibacillus sp. An23]|uniref:(R)-mandelonitrile lyase n=1 Tax=Cloacibacillus sp. An23 TaxID=1965591 RepID=UPI001952641B|nr:cupin domain-containing protein [Cloacibacillus sp. An23]